MDEQHKLFESEILQKKNEMEAERSKMEAERAQLK